MLWVATQHFPSGGWSRLQSELGSTSQCATILLFPTSLGLCLGQVSRLALNTWRGAGKARESCAGTPGKIQALHHCTPCPRLRHAQGLGPF